LLHGATQLLHDPDRRCLLHSTGGAWTIGYKAWGALVGKRLCEQGVLVACLDYRNFPQVCALGASWQRSRPTSRCMHVAAD
jgi:acetyl esterase/lipase